MALVCLAHLGDGAPLPFRWGGLAGVTLFFVLSGYLITTLLLKEQERTGRISLWRFWARRGIRLLPALVVFLALMPVVLWATGDARLAGYPKAAAAALLYVGNIARALGADLGVLNHLWSLAVEEQFYVLWPLLFLLLVRLGRRHAMQVVGAMTLVAIFYSLYAQGSVVRLYVATETNVFALLCGCSLALGLHALPWARQLRPNPLVPALLFVALSTVPGRGYTFDVAVARPLGVLFALLGVWLVAAASQAHSRFLASRPLVFLGTISYALYLWHQGLITSALIRPSSFGGRALLIGLAVVVATLSWYLVERPATRLRKVWRVDPVPPMTADVGPRTAQAPEPVAGADRDPEPAPEPASRPEREPEPAGAGHPAPGER